jgi:hypothetical protein
MSFKSMTFDNTAPPQTNVLNLANLPVTNAYTTVATFTPEEDSFLRVDISLTASNPTTNVLVSFKPTVQDPGNFWETFYIITPNGVSPSKTWMMELVAGKVYRLQVGVTNNCTISGTVVTSLFVR